MSMRRDLNGRPPLLEVGDLSKQFPSWRMFFSRRRAPVEAVFDVSLSVFPGETLGLVGDAGSGRSTLARLILRFLDPSSGRIVFDGLDITKFGPKEMRPVRSDLQFVFDDPHAWLDARRTVGESLAIPFRIYRTEGDTARKVGTLASRVGLGPDVLDRYPHRCSSEDLQRVVIACAVALRPKLIVCDDPVSLLDAGARDKILDLLEDLQDEFKFAYLLGSRDAGEVVRMADRIAVMHHGRIVAMTGDESTGGAGDDPHAATVPSADPRT